MSSLLDHSCKSYPILSSTFLTPAHMYSSSSSLTIIPPRISNLQSSSSTAPAAPTTISSKHAVLSLLSMCKNLDEIKQIHARSVIVGLIGRRPTSAKLLESYVSVYSGVGDAWSIFTQIDSPDTFSYNSMMRGFMLGGNPYSSLLLLSQMLSLHALIPDNYTLTFALKAASLLGAAALMEGKQVHCMIIKTGMLQEHTCLHSSLIHMYTCVADNSSADIDGLNCAQRVFEAFSKGEGGGAAEAAAEEENTLVNNTMISGYMKHGLVNEARKVFDGTAGKDSATWSAMVSGYTRNGMYVEALDVLREMTASQCAHLPNESMLVTALFACARLGALHQGRWIHGYICRRRRVNGAGEINAVLGTALLEMYAKCGSIDESYQVFKTISDKDVVAWTAMISGLAMHGRADRAFEVFDEMVGAGIPPNAASFVALLSACAHSGRVEAGRHYFHSMERDFGIEPGIEHYGCMVDLLGRAGHLSEAEHIIASMPMEPNSIVWGALLDGCRMHKDFTRAAAAFNHLIELEPRRSGDRLKPVGHVLAAEGRWEDAGRVRKLANEGEKGTGCGTSSIEMYGAVHEFVAGD